MATNNVIQFKNEEYENYKKKINELEGPKIEYINSEIKILNDVLKRLKSFGMNIKDYETDYIILKYYYDKKEKQIYAEIYEDDYED